MNINIIVHSLGWKFQICDTYMIMSICLLHWQKVQTFLLCFSFIRTVSLKVPIHTLSLTSSGLGYFTPEQFEQIWEFCFLNFFILYTVLSLMIAKRAHISLPCSAPSLGDKISILCRKCDQAVLCFS